MIASARRLRSPVTALALILALSTAPIDDVRGQTTTDVLSRLTDVRNALITAALHSHGGDKVATLATIDAALLTLQEIESDLADPAMAAELGSALSRLERKIAAGERKITRARVFVDRRVVVPLSKFRVAAKAVGRAAETLGKPVVAEIDPRSAGFHRPGDVVHLQIFAADGTPCLETPVVEVVNSTSSPAVDLSSVSVDEGSGTVTLVMGDGQGGGRVTVTACGRSATVLLYNYGPRAPRGLPKGFPTNVTPGTYRMTVSGSGPGVSVPETVVGVYQLTDLRSFATEIVAAFKAAASSVAPIPGCGQRVSYSPFNGTSFSVNYTLTCSVGGVSATVRLVFRVERI